MSFLLSKFSNFLPFFVVSLFLWFWFLLCDTIWTICKCSYFNLLSSCTHIAINLWMVHLSLCVLYEILNGPYSEKKEFKMNCTRKDFEMPIFKLLNWFAILLISRMCCLIPHSPLYFIVVNLDINMSASTLFDATNYCSTKVRNSLAFVEA